MNSILDYAGINLKDLESFVTRFYIEPRLVTLSERPSAIEDRVKTARFVIEEAHINKLINSLQFTEFVDKNHFLNEIRYQCHYKLLSLPEQVETATQETTVPADWFSHLLQATKIKWLQKYVKTKVIQTNITTTVKKLILPPAGVSLDNKYYTQVMTS